MISIGRLRLYWRGLRDNPAWCWVNYDRPMPSSKSPAMRVLMHWILIVGPVELQWRRE